MRIDKRRRGGSSIRDKKRRMGLLARRTFPDFLHNDSFWGAGIPIAQRMLQTACNDARVDGRLFAKALRLGASLGMPCDGEGALPLHFFARHGQCEWSAHVLLAEGADLDAADASGRGFAHYAFESRNLAMARWIARMRPELCSREDSLGRTPLEAALSHGIDFWRPQEDREAFLEWALEAIPGASKILAERGFAAALLGLPERKDCGALARELAWMASRGAIPAPAQAMAEAICSASLWCREDAEAALRPYIAEQERRAICASARVPGEDAPSKPRLAL